ncbi:DUF721 domain-containing protein [Naumannella sp. ID2617S]|uniref:DUF721 domain-containing protein n=1 Tax=Enemella dayhoffiae TaxID=2016507 RepID=A0A255HBH3_9ACTN|nr:DciA family protein [Enemella dayhoffiae]NNG20129.1 DUF721 domain-containing protein [Naumannella sp. ID2617S]OYO25330.1 hypothetical protein CGZ93_02505 [Enemella dayhoffiae]
MTDPDPEPPRSLSERGASESKGPASDLAAAAEEHDPTGVDLARQIAAQVGAASKGVRRRRRRERPQGVQSSGAHPDDRDPQLLGPALKGLMRQQGWDTQVNVHLLLANWPALVGSINAEHSQPEAYADQVLTIRAESTTWATQLRLFAPQLVARLNDELGQGTVTRVNVIGPTAPSWKHGRRSVKGRGPRDTYG